MRAIAFLSLFFVFVGCGQKATEPDPFDPPPSLGYPVASVRWTMLSADCSTCQTVVSIDSEQRLQIVQMRGSSFQISRAETTQDEWLQSQTAVETALDCSQGDGCQPGLPEERFTMFAGDVGCTARVEGCDEPAIVEARERLRSLVQQYLPEVRF